MSSTTYLGPSLPGVTHHRVSLNGAELHYVSAGSSGTPILLVHGFPESWWAFSKVIPLLAAKHRVFAVDLRGFGDSSTDAGDYSSGASAADLHVLVAHLGVGAVHVTGQDISGGAVFRFAAAHPEQVRSLTGVEMGLAGFGLEALADVARGGAWHIGVLAAPGVPELLLVGRERAFIERHAFGAMCARRDALSEADVAEFARTYSRPGGWVGAAGLYASMLAEGAELRALAESPGLTVPVLAIGAGGGPFTQATLAQAASTEISSVLLQGVGHYAAIEAPEEVAHAVLEFVAKVDAGKS